MRCTSPNTVRRCLMLLCGVLCIALATASARAGEFVISFWCGPPEAFVTVEQYQRIKDAGFTHVMPDCEGGKSPALNRKILDTAAKVGLKAYLRDRRLPTSLESPDARRDIDAVVADYRDHPAFAGYFLGDEPGADAFAGLGEVVAYLREKDPDHPVFINLYPNYAGPNVLHVPTYDDYLARYIAEVKPTFLSYDHYHFLKNHDRPGFFANLETVRQHALASQLPFRQIVLAVDHLNYRRPTEAEKRWLAMQTIAYGGTGVSWFTYWQPAADGKWGQAIIDHDGTPTPQYEQVQRINHDVAALGNALVNATSTAVFQYGMPGDLTHIGDAMPIRFRGTDLTVGLFAEDTTRFALFANRDYEKPAKTTVLINTGAQPLEQLDAATGQWQPVEARINRHGESAVMLQIPAGDAALFRWSTQ